MSAKAFILIEVSAGSILRVLQGLKQIEVVKFSYAITGQYDIIAMIEAPDMAEIGRVALNYIQTIDGVLRTVTCHVVAV